MSVFQQLVEERCGNIFTCQEKKFRFQINHVINEN